jgi:carotenoid cleavage dioxygenase
MIFLSSQTSRVHRHHDDEDDAALDEELLSYQQADEYTAADDAQGAEDSPENTSKVAGTRRNWKEAPPRKLRQKTRRRNSAVIMLVVETLWSMMLRLVECDNSTGNTSTPLTFIKSKRMLRLERINDCRAPPAGVSLLQENTSFDHANFQPIQEEVERLQFKIKGIIPVDLNGLYVRNGPNSRKTEYHTDHLFYGEGMVHGLWLKNGNAMKYKNKFVKLGTKNRLQSGYSNVAVVEHNSRLFSLGEFGPAYELCPNDLSTIGKYDFEGKAGPNISAHPKKDSDGNLHFFVYKIFSPPYLTYYCANQSGKVITTVPIKLDGPKMIHDFMITENYIIFMDLPLIFNDVSTLIMDSLLGKDRSTVPVTFKPDRVSRFGLLPKRGSHKDIRWFNIDTCYIFHTVNAYEKGNEVIFDAVKHKNVDLSDPLKTNASHLTRYCLNLQDGSSKEIMLDDEFVEFPQINPSKLGTNYRYIYCSRHHDVKERRTSSTNPKTSSDERIPPYNGLIKYDLTKKEATHLVLPENMVMGEFSFVEKRNTKREDDGYLLGYVYDKNRMTSSLMIFDATRFSQGPLLATIDLGIRVPNGFHGTWVGNK